mmetsp:Transcript_71457/g.133630  ORF Transcript_71457/g.133630 Transcript_71457/m.133630 type:complete len:205 (-) Transcript_71457:540-1154(-)
MTPARMHEIATITPQTSKSKGMPPKSLSLRIAPYTRHWINSSRMAKMRKGPKSAMHLLMTSGMTGNKRKAKTKAMKIKAVMAPSKSSPNASKTKRRMEKKIPGDSSHFASQTSPSRVWFMYFSCSYQGSLPAAEQSPCSVCVPGFSLVPTHSLHFRTRYDSSPSSSCRASEMQNFNLSSKAAAETSKTKKNTAPASRTKKALSP